MIENVPAQDKAEPLGLYVHVPFCATTCDFCAFYQVTPGPDGIMRYLDGVERELALVAWDRPITTVFWGGGTPGLLPPKALSRLGKAILQITEVKPKEWSVELAPASVTPERLAVLKDLGVTRISLGVQSFQPGVLEALGRKHTRQQIDRAWDLISQADFASVNIDLMFALPGQTDDTWRADLAEAVQRGPSHLSTYCLTFEEDTALWVKLSKGKVKREIEKEARFYEDTWAFLEDTGYAQYEISNFARLGHLCRHNLNTWKMNSWVGIGPSAASQHAGWRGANVADLNQWLAHLTGRRRMTEDRVALTPALLAADCVVFGLRMNAGVNVPLLQTRFPEAPWDSLKCLCSHLEREGLLQTLSGGVIQLTLRGRLLADAVGAEILAAWDQEPAAARF